MLYINKHVFRRVSRENIDVAWNIKLQASILVVPKTHFRANTTYSTKNDITITINDIIRKKMYISKTKNVSNSVISGGSTLSYLFP